MHPIQVLNSSRPKIVEHTLSNGGVLHIRALNAHDYNDMMIRRLAKEPEAFSDLEVTVFGLCDENGKRVFDSLEQGIPIVAEIDSIDLRELSKAVLIASGLLTAKDEAEAEKKS